MSEKIKKLESKHNIKNNKATPEDYKEDIIKLAEFIIIDNIFVKNENRDIYFYDGKKYNLLKHEDLEEKIFSFFAPYDALRKKLKNAGFINQFIKAIKFNKTVKIVELDNYQNLISLKNGILNIDTLELVPHSKDYYFTSIVENIEYKKTEELTFNKILNSSPSFSDYLFSTFDSDMDTIKNIAMMGGCLLSTSFKVNKFFILNGVGANGKSVLLNIIECFFPEKQISALSLKQISGTGHEREPLINSRINITAEDGGGYLDSNEIKKITDKASININPKYEKAYTFKLKAKILLSTNGLPKFKDTSKGLLRRLCIFDFTNEFLRKVEYNLIKNPEAKKIYLANSNIEEEIIKNELSNVLNFFIWGLRELKKNNWEFIMGNSFKKSIETYKKNANTFNEFALENYKQCENLEENEWIKIIDIKIEYENWYRENVQNISPKLSTAVMGKHLKSLFNCEQKDLYRNHNIENYDDITEKKQFSCYPLIKIN